MQNRTLRLFRYLPKGIGLPDDVWNARHRSIVVLLWLHAGGIMVWSLVSGSGLIHSLAEGGIVGIAASAAATERLHRSVRSAIASFGLFSSSAILVHLSGGLIEFHFHFFVIVAVVALYQDWLPFLLAVGFVVLHHGLVGWAFPHDVYNHAAAWNGPWKWAAIHGAFILAECAALLTAWRLSEEGFHDDLTTLPNRTLFIHRIEQALVRSSRKGSPVSVLFMDLDGFKEVNDTYGHSTGDRLLAAVASRIRACLRQSDLAARLGGDEFAVLIEGADEIGLLAVIARILRSLESPFTLSGYEIVVSSSVGVACSTISTAGADELLRDADAALYVAKANGKSRYEFFSEEMKLGHRAPNRSNGPQAGSDRMIDQVGRAGRPARNAATAE